MFDSPHTSARVRVRDLIPGCPTAPPQLDVHHPHPPSCRHVRAALGTDPLQPRLSPSCRDGDISGHGRGIMPGTCQLSSLPTHRAVPTPITHLDLSRASPPHYFPAPPNLYFWTLCHCGVPSQIGGSTEQLEHRSRAVSLAAILGAV